jgi:predicted metal-dependent hydrolase
MNKKVLFVDGIGEVHLVRKARSKQLRIAVRQSGEVLVSIPWLYSFSRGESFLLEKKSWVIQTRLKLEKKGLTRIQLKPGLLFSTRTMKYMVLPMETEKIKVLFQPEEQSVVIGYPKKETLEDSALREKIRLNLEGVLRYDAKRYLPARTRELANQLGYTFKAVTIKNNKTNWGSCSSLKNINLNLHLMRLPDKLIDFIVVHELVHTKIPNHGPSFKERLRGHFPDAEELNREIKKVRPDLF